MCRFLRHLWGVLMEALFKLQHVLDLWGLCLLESLLKKLLAGKDTPIRFLSICISCSTVWYTYFMLRWRICFWVSTIPAAVLAVAMVFCAESPHWLYKVCFHIFLICLEMIIIVIIIIINLYTVIAFCYSEWIKSLLNSI